MGMIMLHSGDPTTDPSRWTNALDVRSWARVLGARGAITLRSAGPVTLTWTRSGVDGVESAIVDGSATPVDVPTQNVEWIWVDGGAEYSFWAEANDTVLPAVTAVMPTFRRESDAIDQARRFAEMDLVAEVLVIDQAGTLRTTAGFTDLLTSSPKIRLIVQPNLGGSGGYARGMLESLASPGNAVLLSDDDAVISEESLRRMVTYQALAPVPTIVGTGMFSAEDPDVLISHSEAVRAADFMWGPADGVDHPTDLAGTTPDQWDFLTLHRPANYAGWWGTLLPPGAVADLGLPAPYFLKWDDSEYGLRAAAKGYAVAVLPGASVWHPTWNAFSTQMTWTARILHRNRLATAAAYSASRGVIRSSLAHQLKHILAGHHLTATLWAAGIEAVLAGSQSWLGTDLLRARGDGQRIVDEWNAATRRAPGPDSPRAVPGLPRGRAALRAVGAVFAPARAAKVVYEMRAEEVTWQSTLGADLVRVIDDRGEVLSELRVCPPTTRTLLRQTLRQHLRLACGWGRLKRDYSRALPQVTTPEAWEHMIQSGSAEEN